MLPNRGGQGRGLDRQTHIVTDCSIGREAGAGEEKLVIIIRPGFAGAVLQTLSWFIESLIRSSYSSKSSKCLKFLTVRAIHVTCQVSGVRFLFHVLVVNGAYPAWFVIIRTLQAWHILKLTSLSTHFRPVLTFAVSNLVWIWRLWTLDWNNKCWFTAW